MAVERRVCSWLHLSYSVLLSSGILASLDFGARDSEFYHDRDPAYGNHCYRIDDLLLVHDSRLEKEQDRKW